MEKLKKLLEIFKSIHKLQVEEKTFKQEVKTELKLSQI